MPSASASAASPRRRCSGASRRAIATVHSTGGSGQSSAARANAPRSTPRSKRALCATSTRPRSSRAELGQHRLRRRRAVDHRLRDPGEALDPARERRRDADERGPAVVQLAAADEHGADLGQLAALAREPVRLGVDGEELGRRERCVEQVLGGAAARTWAAGDTPRTGRHARALHGCRRTAPRRGASGVRFAAMRSRGCALVARGRARGGRAAARTRTTSTASGRPPRSTSRRRSSTAASTCRRASSAPGRSACSSTNQTGARRRSRSRPAATRPGVTRSDAADRARGATATLEVDVTEGELRGQRRRRYAAAAVQVGARAALGAERPAAP